MKAFEIKKEGQVAPGLPLTVNPDRLILGEPGRGRELRVVKWTGPQPTTARHLDVSVTLNKMGEACGLSHSDSTESEACLLVVRDQSGYRGSWCRHPLPTGFCPCPDLSPPTEEETSAAKVVARALREEALKAYDKWVADCPVDATYRAEFPEEAAKWVGDRPFYGHPDHPMHETYRRSAFRNEEASEVKERLLARSNAAFEKAHSAEEKCPHCGGSVPYGDSKYAHRMVYNNSPGTGRILAKGHCAQGDAGRAGGGEELLVMLSPGEGFTISRAGRLYGGAPRHHYRWDGHTLSCMTDQEVRDSFGGGEVLS